MAQPDLEDVIEACMNVFGSQFVANLAAVDARKNGYTFVTPYGVEAITPITSNPPVDWIFGDKGNLPQMPGMLFTGHDTAENEDHFDWRKQTYTLMIEAYYSGDNVENLSRIMRRYGAAIDDTLRQNQTLGGLAGVKNITAIKQQYWDSMSAKTGLFQVCRVTFDVRVYTD